MTSTITPPPADDIRRADGSPRRSRGLLVVVAVLAAIVVGLGIALVAQSNDDGADTAMPNDVQVVLDEFLIAMETNDYEAMQAVVTDDFRRPWFEGDPFGSTHHQGLYDLEDYFRDFEDEQAPVFEIERLGDPIVRGEGPWYVSFAENWEYPAQQVRYEAIYTYAVVVDTDGVLRIDDAYWAGHSVVSVQN